MKNLMRLGTLFVAAALFGATACGGSEPPPPVEEEDTSGTEVVAERVEEEPPPALPAPSPVRVIHAAAAQSQTAMAGTAMGAEAPQYEQLAYQTPSAYVEVQPGAGESSASFTFGAEGGAALEHTVELTAGTPATVVLYTSAEDPALVAALTIPDEVGTVTGQARGRFVNALMGAEAIDLCLPGASRRAAGRPIFMGVAYGDFGGIPSFPSRYQPLNLAGVDSVQVRTANAETPCSGAVLGTAALPEIDLNLAHNLTIIAVGNTARRPRVAKQLLICEDAPGSGACMPVPLR